MSELDEIIDTLWLYSTHENHPWTVEEAYAALRDGGDFVTDGLVWALQQSDVDLKLLALQLLQEHYADAQRALPAVRACILDENRLLRVTAINTVGIMGDCDPSLISTLTPKLESSDDMERIVTAGNLWRICRSEDAYFILRRESGAGDEKPTAMMAQGFLDEDV